MLLELDPSLVQPPESGETQLYLRDSERSEQDRDRTKQRTGESKNRALEEKTAELLQQNKIASLTEEDREIVLFFLS